MVRRLVWSLFIFSAPALAQPVVSPGADKVRQSFGYGLFDEALQEGERLIDERKLSTEEQVQVHRYAGAAAFHLNERRSATRHFTSMLRLDPDARLDPFEFAPPLVSFFDELRRKLEPELAVLRAQRSLVPPPTVRAEPPRLALNFIPFGAPQFQQGRRGMGLFFATSQSVAAATSLVALISYYGAMSRRSVEIAGVRSTEWALAPRLANFAGTWRTLNLISTIAFYALYAAGVGDAFFNRPQPTELALRW
jgi:hypothetical protein